MPLNPPVLDDRSFDELVNEMARRSPFAHELTHVVQQASGTEVGRRRLLNRLQGADPVLWFALTSGAPLTQRQSEKLARYVASGIA